MLPAQLWKPCLAILSTLEPRGGQGLGRETRAYVFEKAQFSLPRAGPKCSFSAVSFSSNFGRLAFAIAYVVFDQSSVRNESWGKEMMTLANVDEIHNTQAPWGSVTGLGPLQSWEQGHSGLLAPFRGLSVLVLRWSSQRMSHG